MSASVYVTFTHAFHRNTIIQSGTFVLIKPFDPKSCTLTIQAKIDEENNCYIPHPAVVVTPRIQVEQSGFYYSDENGVEVDPPVTLLAASTKKVAANTTSAVATPKESDEVVIERISNTFVVLEELTEQIAQTNIHSLIVRGVAGIGKSFVVDQILRKMSLDYMSMENKKNYEFVSGSATPIAVYKKLFARRERGLITVFDDCDSIMANKEALSVLMAGLDSKPVRTISWLGESHALRRESIEDSFQFEGSVIILTNTPFDDKNNALAPQLTALRSRSHMLDLGIQSVREQLLRIKQVVNERGMLDKYEFEQEIVEDILAFITSNAPYMNDLSLRAVLKIAAIAYNKPDRWRQIVSIASIHPEFRGMVK